MHTRYFHALLALSVITSAALYAQEEVRLDSVKVSANKIEEDIKDIPQSITVLNEVALEERGIKNVADVVNEIPNLTSSFFYSNQINFRGINSSMFTNNNPVVIYIDGVPQSNRYGYEASLANVERIEVLRGPQGAIYGKDSIGGVINIITKTPQNEWQGALGAEYGNHNAISGTFNASGALKPDELFLGLNGSFSKDDGWITNQHPGMKENADEYKDYKLNLNVTYKPTERLTTKVSISRDKSDQDWVDGGLAPVSQFNSLKKDDFKNANFDQDTFTKITSNAQSLQLSYDLDSVLLTSVTTHKKVDVKGEYDLDFSYGSPSDGLIQFQYLNSDTLTQELRLSSQNSHDFRWVGGLYYEKEKFTNEWYGGQSASPFPAEMDAPSVSKSETKAIFGQGVAHLGEDFELTLGARYQTIEKKIDLDFYYTALGMGKGAPMFSLDEKHRWNAFLPKIALSYKLNDHWNTYASISKGYLPGGYNYFAMMGSAEDNRFDAQTSVDYEIGIRGDMLGNRLQLQAALFYMDIKDVHVYNIDPLNPMNFRTSNAGAANSKGIELEAFLRATDRIDLNAAIGIIKAQYDDYMSSVNVGSSNANNKIENTPAFTAKAGVSYTDPSGVYGRFDVRAQGSTYFDAENTLKEESHVIADAKVGYRWSNWDVYSYIKNITDKSYIQNATNRNDGSVFVAFGAGRSFGIGGRYLF